MFEEKDLENYFKKSRMMVWKIILKSKWMKKKMTWGPKEAMQTMQTMHLWSPKLRASWTLIACHFWNPMELAWWRLQGDECAKIEMGKNWL